jgi:hypothetical protein
MNLRQFCIKDREGQVQTATLQDLGEKLSKLCSENLAHGVSQKCPLAGP